MTPQRSTHRHLRSGVLAAILLGAMVLLLPACRRAAPADAPAQRLRIICLSPAVTDMLVALELGDRIVGRDAYEEQLPDSVPRVGDLTSVNLEAVLALNPTDIILQAGRAGAPPRLESIAAERGWRFINLQIDGLDDAQLALRRVVEELSFAGDDQSQRVAARRRATELLAEMDAALASLPAATTARLGPVLLLYFTDPPSAFGPGSYLSDMLARLGADNALTGGAWQELDLERVAAIDPWAIIVVKPGASPQQTEDPQSLLGSVGRLNLTCARAGRIAVLRHERALLPGASLIEAARELRDILESLAMGGESRGP